MFNFFKKKQEAKKPVKKEAKGTPFNIERHKADLQALYECSVQKTAKDFAVQQVAVDGGTINVAMDSIDGYDAKTFQQAYNPNFVGEEVIFTHFAANGFIGFNNCSILAQDWLINKCLALPCEDAISINYDLLLKDDEVTDEDKDIIEKLKNLSNDDGKYKIKSTLNSAKKVINLINPFWWAKKLVVNVSMNIVINKLALVIISIVGEEVYKVYSKKVFLEESNINSISEDEIKEIENELEEGEDLNEE